MILRWVLPLVVAAGVTGAEALVRRLAGVPQPRKGEVALRVVRARHDTVLDLHATYAKEAQQARQSYVPIYIKDDKLLHRDKEPIVAAAMARKIGEWHWSKRSPSRDAGVEADKAGPVPGRPVDAGLVDARPKDGVGRGERADARLGRPFVGPPSPASSQRVLPPPPTRPRLPWQVRATRRRNLQVLLYGCFKLMEPYYAAGVIPDSEFPNEKRHVRVLAYGRYRRHAVAGLRRFSELRPMLERSTAQFFYQVPAAVRMQAIDFVLQRLPGNLRYAESNKRHIADISQITGIEMVLVRRGTVVVRRGHTVDTRADNALRALSARVTPESERRSWIGRLLLVWILMLLFTVGGWQLLPPGVTATRVALFVGLGLVVLALGGHGILSWWAIHSVSIPQAAVALVMAAVVGRGAAVMAALVVAAVLGVSFLFDVEGILVGCAGGLAGAFAVRHRRLAALLPAGVIVGLAQALTSEACRAAAGRPQTYAEIWIGAQAFFGGVMAGVLAVVTLPFVQRWFGMASRGKLKSLADYDHALARRLRELQPEVFSHTLRVVNLADRAAKEVGADRLLCRVGALFHDIGKLSQPPQGDADSIAHRAAQRRAHVTEGVKLAREERFPEEVIALIEEHHGTMEMADLAREAAARGDSVVRSSMAFGGPRPRTVESAILLLANEVERATQSSEGEDVEEVVERLVLDLIAQHQLADCQTTHWHLRRIQRAMVAFVRETRQS